MARTRKTAPRRPRKPAPTRYPTVEALMSAHPLAARLRAPVQAGEPITIPAGVYPDPFHADARGGYANAMRLVDLLTGTTAAPGAAWDQPKAIEAPELVVPDPIPEYEVPRPSESYGLGPLRPSEEVHMRRWDRILTEEYGTVNEWETV